MTAWSDAVAPAPAARAGSGPAAFTAELVPDWDAFVPRWRALTGAAPATPFQGERWLGTWFGTMVSSGRAPVLVAAACARTGRDAALLPLTLSREGRLREIAFADGGITDYNAPALCPETPTDRASARALWRAVRAALPPADLLRLEKMPETVAGRPNPLIHWPGARASRLSGHVLAIEGSWEEHHRGQERRFRKEQERAWRVFTRAEGAAFRVIEDGDEARRVLGILERQQADRIRALGRPYLLDDPAIVGFYRALVDGGLADGSIRLTALLAGDEVVAALLGIVAGRDYAMVRLSTGGEAWNACSPGRLVIERTIHHLHAQGARRFDFTIGDYPYKRRLGAVPRPLHDLTHALSWRGLPLAGRDAGAAAIHRNPTLARIARATRALLAGGRDKGPDRLAASGAD